MAKLYHPNRLDSFKIFTYEESEEKFNALANANENLKSANILSLNILKIPPSTL